MDNVFTVIILLFGFLSYRSIKVKKKLKLGLIYVLIVSVAFIGFGLTHKQFKDRTAQILKTTQTTNSSSQKNTERSKSSSKKSVKVDIDDFLIYAKPILDERMNALNEKNGTNITINLRNVGGVIAVALPNELKYQDTSTIQSIVDSTQSGVRDVYIDWAHQKGVKLSNKFNYPVMWIETDDTTKIATDSNVKRTMKLEKEFLGK